MWLILISLLLLHMSNVQSACNDCPPENLVTSDQYPNLFDVTSGNIIPTSDIQQLFADPTFLLILSPATGFVLDINISPTDLMVCSMSIVVLLSKNTTVTFFDSGNVVVGSGECLLPGNNGFNGMLCDFDFNPPVMNPANLIVTVFEPTLEAGVKDARLELCVQTNWCEWSNCTSEGIRTRVCECPNPDPATFVCPGPSVEDCPCCPDHPDQYPPMWGEWTEWSECSEPCNRGTKHRTRECMVCPECDPAFCDCECYGSSHEMVDCEGECDTYFINNELYQFQTAASVRSATSGNALYGTGLVWISGVNDVVYWYAYLPKDSCCQLVYIEFEFKYSNGVLVSEMLFGENTFTPVQNIPKPTDVDEWSHSGVIHLSANVRRVELEISPSSSYGPTACLRNVIVQICCAGEPTPCENYLLNYDLTTKASLNTAASAMALIGSGGDFSPEAPREVFWFATINNYCCGMYTLQFEVKNVWQVVIFHKYRSGGSFYQTDALNFTPDGDWHSSDLIILDNETEPRDVFAVKIKLVPAWVYGVKAVPRLRNVAIYMCCDDQCY